MTAISANTNTTTLVSLKKVDSKATAPAVDAAPKLMPAVKPVETQKSEKPVLAAKDVSKELIVATKGLNITKPNASAVDLATPATDGLTTNTKPKNTTVQGGRTFINFDTTQVSRQGGSTETIGEEGGDPPTEAEGEGGGEPEPDPGNTKLPELPKRLYSEEDVNNVRKKADKNYGDQKGGNENGGASLDELYNLARRFYQQQGVTLSDAEQAALKDMIERFEDWAGQTPVTGDQRDTEIDAFDTQIIANNNGQPGGDVDPTGIQDYERDALNKTRTFDSSNIPPAPVTPDDDFKDRLRQLGFVNTNEMSNSNPNKSRMENYNQERAKTIADIFRQFGTSKTNDSDQIIDYSLDLAALQAAKEKLQRRSGSYQGKGDTISLINSLIHCLTRAEGFSENGTVSLHEMLGIDPNKI